MVQKSKRKKEIDPKKPPCGLCGKKKHRRIKTDCCNNLICNDSNDYILFSYSRKSCWRNHSRFTLCAYHHNDEHKGDWI